MPVEVLDEERGADGVDREMSGESLRREGGKRFFGLVTVDLERAGRIEDEVERTVERDGCGLDRGFVAQVEAIFAARQACHVGLAGRQRRAECRADPAGGSDHQCPHCDPLRCCRGESGAGAERVKGKALYL